MVRWPSATETAAEAVRRRRPALVTGCHELSRRRRRRSALGESAVRGADDTPLSSGIEVAAAPFFVLGKLSAALPAVARSRCLPSSSLAAQVVPR